LDQIHPIDTETISSSIRFPQAGLANKGDIIAKPRTVVDDLKRQIETQAKRIALGFS
jgi:hypothetical protein